MLGREGLVCGGGQSAHLIVPTPVPHLQVEVGLGDVFDELTILLILFLNH